MSKPSHGTMRSAVSKKKTKKRPELRPMPEPLAPEAVEPVRPQPAVAEKSNGSTLQFRPRAREAARPARAHGGTRFIQQVANYGYVYADLKVIGVLSLLLFGALIALSFVIQ